MLTHTKIPSIQETFIIAQQLVDKAYNEGNIEYERLGLQIKNGLCSINREVEQYSAAEVIEELGINKIPEKAQEKEVWSVAEAAEYYGIAKSSFQNMISKLRRENTVPDWLLLPTEEVRKIRIHTKKFKKWYVSSPKAKGRPRKEI